MSPSILRIRCPTEYFYLTAFPQRTVKCELENMVALHKGYVEAEA